MKRFWAAIVMLMLLSAVPSALAAPSVGVPNIPLGQDLRGYDPHTDGYYAVIGLYAWTSRNFSLTTQLPLLIYQDVPLIRAEDLARLFGVQANEYGSGDLELKTRNRSLFFHQHSAAGKWVVDSVYGMSSPLVEENVTFSGRPQWMEDEIWVPLTDTAVFLGMPLYLAAGSEGDDMLCIRPPERTALDVLADLSDPRARSEQIYNWPEQYRDEILTMAMAAGLDEGVNNLMSLNLTEFIRQMKGTNIAPFIDAVAGLEQNEYLEMTDKMAESCQTMLDFADLLPDGGSIEALSEGFEKTGFALTLISSAAMKDQFRWTFEHRDTLAIEGLSHFAEGDWQARLGEARAEAAYREIRSLQSSRAYSISHLLEDKWVDLAIHFGEWCIHRTSLAGITSAAYIEAEKAISSVVPLWASTFEAMDAFELSMYGQIMEPDTEAMLAQTLDSLAGGIGQEEMKACMADAYLFLKTCDMARKSAYTALSWDFTSTAKEDLAILARDYQDDAILAMTPEKTVEYAGSSDYAALVRAAKPLYMHVNGQVLRRDTKRPVEDAEIRFTCAGYLCGTINGTPGGIYPDVYVPLLAPGHIDSATDQMRLVAEVSSPSSRGREKVGSAYSQNSVTLPTAYLGGSELCGSILDADTQLPLGGVTVSCFSSDQEYTAVTDSQGAFDIKGMAAGDYTLRSEKANYQLDTRPISIETDTVHALLYDIELQPLTQIDPIVLYYDAVHLERTQEFQGILMHLTVEAENHRDTQEKMSDVLAYRYEIAEENYEWQRTTHFDYTEEGRKGRYSFTIQSSFIGPCVSVVATETYMTNRSDGYATHSVLVYPPTGERMRLPDLFLDEEALEAFEGLLRERLEADPFADQFYFKPAQIASDFVDGTSSGVWLLEKDRLIVKFDEYDIGPHSIGSFYFAFSLQEDLDGLIKPGFLPGKVFAVGRPQLGYAPEKDGLTEYGSPSGVCIEVDRDIQDLYVYKDNDLVLQANYLEHAQVWLHHPLLGSYRMVWSSKGKEKAQTFTIAGTEERPELTITAMADDEGPQIDLSQCVVQLLQEQYTYTGGVILPKLEVTYQGTPLLRGMDYEISSRSVEPGRASATLTGIEDFTGEVSVAYDIVYTQVTLDAVDPLRADQRGEVTVRIRTTRAESVFRGAPGENTIAWRLDTREDSQRWEALVMAESHADEGSEFYTLTRGFSLSAPGEYRLTVTYNGVSAQRVITVEPEISLEIGPRLKDGTLAEGESRTWITSYTDVRFLASYEEDNANFIWQFMRDLPVERDALAPALDIVHEHVELDEENRQIALVLRVKPNCPENQAAARRVTLAVVTPAGQACCQDLRVTNGLIVPITFRSLAPAGEAVAGSTETSLSHLFYYTDDYFYKSAYRYNNSLAVMSLGMELSSYTTPQSDYNYAQDVSDQPALVQQRAQNLIDAMNALQFNRAGQDAPQWSSPELHHYGDSLASAEDKAAYAFGFKYIASEHSDDTLVAVVIRGGGYGAEWASNFNVGNDGNHHGFKGAADEVEQALEDYVSRLQAEGRIVGGVRYWITGFSRAGAVSNLLAFSLNNKETIGGVETDPQSQYVYTFATPAGHRGAHGRAANIFNLVSENDIVPRLALKEWGFIRCGRSIYLPTETPEQVRKAYQRLAGETLKVSDMDFFERQVIDILGKMYPDTDSFVVTAQGSMTSQIAEDCKVVTGSFLGGFAGGLMDGIRQDYLEPFVQNMKANKRLNADELRKAFSGSSDWRIGMVQAAAEQAQKYVETTGKQLESAEDVLRCLGAVVDGIGGYIGGEDAYLLRYVYEYTLYREAGNTGSVNDFFTQRWEGTAGNQQEKGFIERLLRDIGGVTSKQFHYPEHYLAWLESAGATDPNRDFATLTQAERDAIGQYIIGLIQ